MHVVKTFIRFPVANISSKFCIYNSCLHLRCLLRASSFLLFPPLSFSLFVLHLCCSMFALSFLVFSFFFSLSFPFSLSDFRAEHKGRQRETNTDKCSSVLHRKVKARLASPGPGYFQCKTNKIEQERGGRL